MKVNVERDIDVERLLINLNEKAKCSSVGMAGYDVTVSKQMLRDAHDVIKQLTTEVKKEPRYKNGSDTFSVAESVLDNNELINCQVVIYS